MAPRWQSLFDDAGPRWWAASSTSKARQRNPPRSRAVFVNGLADADADALAAPRIAFGQ